MKLAIQERLLLLNVLPLEGNLTTMRIISNLRDSLGLTEQDFKDYEVKQDGDQVSWKNGDLLKDIEIGEKATDLIVETLNKLDKENKLTLEYLPLCDKFNIK